MFALFVSLLVTASNAQTTFPDWNLLSGIALPWDGLQQHIAAIYHDESQNKDFLYVFGGANVTTFTMGSPNKIWYRLDVTSWSSLTLNDDNTDIATAPTGDWEVIDNVVPPTYGYSGDGSTAIVGGSGTYEGQEKGVFLCKNRCSALIGDFLYIVAPQTKNHVYSIDYMYRVDLSKDPPEFDSDSNFNALLSDTTGDTGKCVATDGTDLYYAGGYNNTAYLYESGFIQYDVSEDDHVALTSFPDDSARNRAGCVFTPDLTKLYIIGGTQLNSKTYGQRAVDWYTFDTSEWTDNADDTDYTTSYDISRSATGLQCVTNPYIPVIECPGGLGTSSFAQISNNDDVFNTDSNELMLSSTLYSRIQYAPVVTFTLDVDDNSVEGVVLHLIIGGFELTDEGNEKVSNELQYTVRYTQFTAEPTTTASPTPSPTGKPTGKGGTPEPSEPPTAEPTMTMTGDGSSDSFMLLPNITFMVVGFIALIMLY